MAREHRVEIKVLYVNESGAKWVYYTETRSDADARAIAVELNSKGKRVLVCDEYRGPVVTL